MAGLTLKEFWKLDEKTRGERYAELSDEDKRMVRLSAPIGPGIVIGKVERTEEERRESDETFAKILVEFGVIKDVKEYEKFEKFEKIEPDK